MSHSILAAQKMFVEKLRSFEESITTRASKALEEFIYIICMNDMIVKSQQFNCFLPNFPLICPTNSPT